MKFSGIDMQGDFKAQIVADASALVYASSDERRMIYDETTTQAWMADSSTWKSIGLNGDIPAGTEMWFYADSAPTGWTLNATPSDQLLAIKGGTTYTVGGAAAGSFTTPNHYHSLNSHVHAVIGTTSSVSESHRLHKGDGPWNGSANHNHNFSLNTSGPSPVNTATDGGTAGYRPDSYVGIICTKD